jgi:hypothetical protein
MWSNAIKALAELAQDILNVTLPPAKEERRRIRIKAEEVFKKWLKRERPPDLSDGPPPAVSS